MNAVYHDMVAFPSNKSKDGYAWAWKNHDGNV